MPRSGGEQHNIGGTVRTGLALTGSADTLRHIVEFATSIVLARLLLPEDFGIVAVVASFLQISYVVGNFGMGGAVVQASDISRRDLDAAFTLSTLVAGALTAGGAAIGGWSAGFFDMPLLTTIMPIMSAQILLAGIAAIPIAVLRRDLRFGRLAIVEGGSAVVFAVVGLGMALNGFGVWSLVWAPLASNAWMAGAAVVLSGYLPRPGWERSSLAKFLAFGGGLTLKNVFVYIGRNLDNLIVAKLLGGAPVGFYNRAFNLTRMPQTRLVGMLYRVCFPAFCRLRNDTPRFHDWYVKATVVVAVGITPMLLGLCVLAEDFILAVLGEQWSGMIICLRILCVSALFSSLHMLGGAAIEASGRIRYEVFTESAYAVMIVVGCAVGAYYGGIEGAALAVLAAAVVLYATKSLTLYLAIGLHPRRYFAAALPSLIAGVVMFVSVHYLLNYPPEPLAGLLTGHWMRLVVGTITGALVYTAAHAIVGRQHLRLLFSQAGMMLRAGMQPQADAPSDSHAAAEAPLQ